MLWPTRREVSEAVEKAIAPQMFKDVYADVYTGDKEWQSLAVPEGDLYQWDESSTYVKNPPYFVDMGIEPAPVAPIVQARVLARSIGVTCGCVSTGRKWPCRAAISTPCSAG